MLGIVLDGGLRKGVVGEDGQPSLDEHTALPRASLLDTWAHVCSVCKGTQLCWLNYGDLRLWEEQLSSKKTYSGTQQEIRDTGRSELSTCRKLAELF